MTELVSAERRRLQEVQDGQASSRRWGPYLSECGWGTVREDYSASGQAWEFFPHDHARAHSYRWNQDGLAGLCDERQTLCFALAFWSDRDPILKERIFGLTGNEGNHGEDAKEYWFMSDGGAAIYGAHLSVGETSGALFRPGLLFPQSARVHLALHDHGPADPAIVSQELHSFGVCNPTCMDVQFAVFES